MDNARLAKDKVFKVVQQFLQNPPVIIWGSGATIPYGIPGMDDLRESLKSELEELDENTNLEKALGEIQDSEKVDRIKKIVRNEILKKDQECLERVIQNTGLLNPIVKMIEKFYNAHPQKIDIVTTNYDRVLEYALSLGRFPYTDGFTGRALSKFNKNSFRSQCVINLIKVHGSLNWIFCATDPLFMPCECRIDDLKYAMVLPSEKKYREAFSDPYRDLIGKLDEAIEAARSLLAVGFGFNDEHLTPKIESKIRQSTPIVIITKKATDSWRKKIKSSANYCLFEQETKGTKVTFREKANSVDVKQHTLCGNYWKLDQFMEILGS